MRSRTTVFRPVKASLTDLLGRDYAPAICEACAFLSGVPKKELLAIAGRKVDFYPPAFQKRMLSLLPRVGERVRAPLRATRRGATSREFERNTRTDAAPLSGLGLFRIGEDGRLRLVSKSEHYHAPLGHGFPGYRLIDHARRLGIPNATHNSARGHITRLLEEELVRTANGIARDDEAGLRRVLESTGSTALNRVLNLETGSLAMEAALKMMLGRFCKPQADSPEPKYRGRVPVLAVIGDADGGLEANYHGTTFLAQMLRGMWPEALAAFEKRGILLVRAVRPENMEDLEALFQKYEKSPYKIAGFLYEIVLMNYGGLKLSKRFVRRAHTLCRRHDAPTAVDEIQSCLWHPDLYMFREYGVRPTFVAVGKGFPGGEYPASRILFNSRMDCLPQFGALVTNGQEELASLAYLITMRWAEANADVTRAVGDYYEERLRALASDHSSLLDRFEGSRHMGALFFHEIDAAKAFVARLVAGGIDISVQAYKAACPPAALTKLPLTAGCEAADFIVARMGEALRKLGG
ncbi:MAG TPA: aminotransferase class III-fold pyridoxal phosphate-dependent enzyme [Sumerlaeia bacterium]|nr:aminotransferase class III-fold pyridoxal phosphate-dependent enzyme [Sumerlaeia bacterium]